MYDYLKAMVDDIKSYINSGINIEDYEDRNELEEYLNDALWTENSVTGNACGSYTSNRQMAKVYVTANMGICKEAVKEFDTDLEIIAEHFLSEDWEYFDVSIRCYLLGQAISAALDEIKI